MSCPATCFDTTFDARKDRDIKHLSHEHDEVPSFLQCNQFPEKILFGPNSVQVEGKEMGLLLDPDRGMWMTIHFELQAHPVVMRNWELAAFMNGTHPTRARRGRTAEEKKQLNAGETTKRKRRTPEEQEDYDYVWVPFILPAIILQGSDEAGVSVCFYDHNKLI